MSKNKHKLQPPTSESNKSSKEKKRKLILNINNKLFF